MTLLTFANIFGCSGCYNISAFIATLRANVYHMVCALYDVHIVLDYDYCMSMCDESFKRVHQRMYVVEMKPGGWFIKDEHSRARFSCERKYASLTRWFSPPLSSEDGWPSLM